MKDQTQELNYKTPVQMPDDKRRIGFLLILVLFASVFIISGFVHFIYPESYVRIIPPFLPWPKMLVQISGGAEIFGGVGLLLQRSRRFAAFGLTLLLVAVFPANVYMAVAHVRFSGLMGQSWVQWLRLPMQIPLILWAMYYATDSKRRFK